MILGTNYAPIAFTGAQKANKLSEKPDTSIYADLMRHHELVSIALDTESKEEKVIAVHINPINKKPITIWRSRDSKESILVSDHNFRNGMAFTIPPEDKNFARIKALVEHHIKNYERQKKEQQGDVSFTGALKAQALLKI